MGTLKKKAVSKTAQDRGQKNYARLQKLEGKYIVFNDKFALTLYPVGENSQSNLHQ